MGKKDARFDSYISKSADFAQPILKHIRKLVHLGCPEVEEDMKWGAPHFMYKSMLCSMAAFKKHCVFGFWKEALRKNKKASKVFAGFSYSNKREYVEWLTEAKTEETRQKRLATALEWMAEGKVRNWKYIKK